MKKLKIKIIVADYYKEITNPLTKSCVNILEQNNLKYEIITVPGAVSYTHLTLPTTNSV